MDSRKDNVIVDEPVKRPEPVMHAGQRVEDGLTSEQPVSFRNLRGEEIPFSCSRKEEYQAFWE